MVDRLSEAINTIKTHELLGRSECTVNSTKLVRAVLDTMKKEEYIDSYEEFNERHAKKLKIKLSNKINGIGAIKPRFSISKTDIQKYESRYIPSKDFGMLIISTSFGVLSSKDIKERNTGGKLLAYVY